MLLSVNDYLLPCLNKKLFGMECPGCGMQRSFILLIQGEFTEAFKMYPAIFTLVLLAISFIADFMFNFKHFTIYRNILIGINLAIIIVSYIIKMQTTYF